jgi:cytoskeletal protein CcmA (bactofilin family)
MWNRSKKDEEIAPRQAGTTPTSDFGREAIPVSTHPTRPPEYGNTRTSASVGKSITIHGRISGKEDLVIDGRLEGDVDLPENRLTVGATGQVQGGIRAREIVVYGVVQGNLEAAERVEIRKNARVVGDLKAQRPVIEDEAYFKGNVETIRVDAPKPQPQPQPKAQAAAVGAAEHQPSLLGDKAPEIKTEIKRG